MTVDVEMSAPSPETLAAWVMSSVGMTEPEHAWLDRLQALNVVVSSGAVVLYEMPAVNDPETQALMLVVSTLDNVGSEAALRIIDYARARAGG